MEKGKWWKINGGINWEPRMVMRGVWHHEGEDSQLI